MTIYNFKIIINTATTYVTILAQLHSPKLMPMCPKLYQISATTSGSSAKLSALSMLGKSNKTGL